MTAATFRCNRCLQVSAASGEGDKAEHSKPKRNSLDWLKKAPRIRIRRPENRCPDQLLELTVLNERLLGSSSWEVRQKVEYLKKRQENWDMVYEIIVKREAAATLKTIEEASKKAELALSQKSKESKSVVQLKKELVELQKEVEQAHETLHVTQTRVVHNMKRAEYLKTQLELNTAQMNETVEEVSVDRLVVPTGREVCSITGLRLCAKRLYGGSLVPVELFGKPWVLFRDESGSPACLHDECAHRACPLSIGKVVDGNVSCPYHGWEYNTRGQCVKMPSTVYRKDVAITSLPAVEKDGFIWIWPGTKTPQEMPDYAKPLDGFDVFSEVEAEWDADQGSIISNLLDDGIVPFKNFLKKGRPGEFPSETSFHPPCSVSSVMKLTASTSPEARRHAHQLYICVPVGDRKVKILHRVSLNFWKIASQFLLTRQLFQRMAQKSLTEDLILEKEESDVTFH